MRKKLFPVYSYETAIELETNEKTPINIIIVTHNKRTMSAAKYIYGVTQQEDGISKVVSVDMK